MAYLPDSGARDFHLPSSYYDPPEEPEHDDDCELLDEDTLADETITKCQCWERLQAHLADMKNEPDEPDDPQDDWYPEPHDEG